MASLLWGTRGTFNLGCLCAALFTTMLFAGCGQNDAQTAETSVPPVSANAVAPEPPTGTRESSDPLVPRFAQVDNKKSVDGNDKPNPSEPRGPTGPTTPQSDVKNPVLPLYAITVGNKIVRNTDRNWGAVWTTEADTIRLQELLPTHLQWDFRTTTQKSDSGKEKDKHSDENQLKAQLKAFGQAAEAFKAEQSLAIEAEHTGLDDLAKLLSAVAAQQQTFTGFEISWNDDEIKKPDTKSVKYSRAEAQAEFIRKYFPNAKIAMRVSSNTKKNTPEPFAQSEFYDSLSFLSASEDWRSSSFFTRLEKILLPFEKLGLSFLRWKMPAANSNRVQAEAAAFLLRSLQQPRSVGTLLLDDASTEPAAAKFFGVALRGSQDVLLTNMIEIERVPQLSDAINSDAESEKNFLQTPSASVLRNERGEYALLVSNSTNTDVRINLSNTEMILDFKDTSLLLSPPSPAILPLNSAQIIVKAHSFARFELVAQ